MNDQNHYFSMIDTPFSKPEETEIHDEVPETHIENVFYEKMENTKEDRLVFDLVNAPPSHANALRRTLLADIPSMAFDLVGVDQNTSVMPDEVLCHRIGLIPLNVDSSLFEFPPETPNPQTEDDPNIVLLFGLHVIGGDGPDPNYDSVDYNSEGNLLPIYTGPTGKVLSSHFVWLPFEGQTEKFPTPPSVLHDDIEITTLKFGQELHLYARAYKGTGSIHAKFSPVCTAYYRSLPLIEIDQNALNDGELKQRLVDTCPCHVFEIEDTGDVIVQNPRNCTMCRECTRRKRLNASVKLGTVPNCYEFTVESLGVKSSPQLFKEALEILINKCKKMKDAVEEARPK